MAQHNSLVLVANGVIGGGDGKKAPPKSSDSGVKDLGAGHQSVEEAVAAINSAFTF